MLKLPKLYREQSGETNIETWSSTDVHIRTKVLGRLLSPCLHYRPYIVEIEAILNDRPLTYMYLDETDPEPLTPSHLLYGRQITMLPYRVVNIEDDELADPDYTPGPVLREKTKKHTVLLQYFQKHWKREYFDFTPRNSQSTRKEH